jgi:TRAP-type C4-dicarboxylate transport system substrate-binding protein
MQTFLPPTDPDHSINYAKFCEMVEKNTDGRVKITLFPVGAIVQAPELMSATRDGVLEVSSWSVGYGQGAIPILGIIDGLPMTFQNGRELAEILWDFGLSELSRDAYNKYGVYLLGHHPQSCCGLGMLSTKPVRTLADLKGLKIRTHGSFVEFWRRLGCGTVAAPLSEVYLALTTGVVDGVTTDWSAHIIFKFVEVAKYGVLPSMIGATGGHIIVNPKAWNSLPDDLKHIVSLTWRDWASWSERYFQPYLRASHGGSHEAVIKDLKDRGIKFTTLSPADQAKMLEIAMKMWDDTAAKDPLSAKGVDIIKNYYKKIGRLK